MAILLSDEFRLLYALVLQAAPLLAAWRFVRRHAGPDDSAAGRAADALLLALLVQYAAVCLPGLVGLLCPLSIAGVTLGLSGLLYALSRGSARVAVVSAPSRFALACALFAGAYVVALAYNSRFSPVLANDALTYHFPAAVRWLHAGRITVFETWFFNPANAYSPLAGSTFVAALIAPVGNDVLARHVQLPALALTFCAAVRLMRGLGVRAAVAGVCGVAMVLSQPFLRQAIIEKDDLFLAAFATCAVAGCACERLRDPLGAARVGVALGLLLATKYTALLALPALALAIDAPFRAGWRRRRFATAVGLAFLIAGPWYLRNWVATGNPLYPLRTLGLPGLFATTRSDQFSPAHAWAILTARDQSLPAAVMIPLLVLWCAALGLCAMAGARRTVATGSDSPLAAPHGAPSQGLSDPVLRAALLAPPVSIAIFFAASPYPEARFLYPAFALLFVAAAVALARINDRFTGAMTPPPRGAARGGVQVAIAIVLLLIPSWATGIKLSDVGRPIVAQISAAAVVLAAAAMGAIYVFRRYSIRRTPALQYVLVVASLGVAAMLYTQWAGFIESCRQAAQLLYSTQYGPTADAWQFVRDKLPSDETLAYSNTYLVHPMTGFDHGRQLVYVPTRRGVNRLSDLPPITDRPLSGERLVAAVAAVTVGDPDPVAWLEKLRASGATHLILFKRGATAEPPERAMIESAPRRFEIVFENAAATIYRLR